MTTKYRDHDPQIAKNVDKYSFGNSNNICYATMTADHDPRA